MNVTITPRTVRVTIISAGLAGLVLGVLIPPVAMFVAPHAPPLVLAGIELGPFGLMVLTAACVGVIGGGTVAILAIVAHEPEPPESPEPAASAAPPQPDQPEPSNPFVEPMMISRRCAGWLLVVVAVVLSTPLWWERAWGEPAREELILLATLALLALFILATLLTWYFLFRAGLHGVGLGYAVRHLVLGVALFPVLLTGVFAVPAAVQSDLLKLEPWDDHPPELDHPPALND